tara:strand:+ start:383 stop:682 length:300 start_codon:yes stop_codon:yes gene_type:complete
MYIRCFLLKIKEMIMQSSNKYLTYEDKITYLRSRVKANKVHNDQGWKAVSELLGLGGHCVLKQRIVNKQYKKEWDLAADSLINSLHNADQLSKFTHEVK